MLAFNHEKFVAQAIESVLMQQVRFPIELLIGEDCSTDSTRAIVSEYATRYPDVIVPLLYERNLGAHENFQRLFKAARGTYHAMLEGDDYWTHPLKLQGQVEVLDSNADYAVAAHNVDIVYENHNRASHPMHAVKLPERHTLQDILSGNFIGSPSVLYRAGLFPEFPNWFIDMPLGDWTLHILNAVHGDIYFNNEIQAAYRVHAGGAWSQMSSRIVCERTLVVAKAVDRHFDFRYHAIVRRSSAGWHFQIAEAMDAEGATSGIQKHLWIALTTGFGNDKIPVRRALRLLWQHATPRTYALALKTVRALRARKKQAR